MNCKPEAKHVLTFRTRGEAASWYAEIIRYHPSMSVARINKAIIDRWSFSALEYIKLKAWKEAYPKSEAKKMEGK